MKKPADSDLNSGRINQKHRTRNALLEAAAKLMREGHIPSVEEIADAAKVSRATAYRYFPTREHIAGSALLSANLDSEARLKAGLISPDAATRLDYVVEAFHERFSTNEAAYRTLLSLMLDRATSESQPGEEPHLRASRHVYWLQQALMPIQRQLGEAAFARLVAALAAATGFEAYIALRDISQIDTSGAKEIMRWTAQSLLKASLSELDR